MRSACKGQTLSFQVPFCFMRTDASKAQEDRGSAGSGPWHKKTELDTVRRGFGDSESASGQALPGLVISFPEMPQIYIYI